MTKEKQIIALCVYVLVAAFVAACSASDVDTTEDQTTIPIEKLPYSATQFIDAVSFIEDNAKLPARVAPLRSYSRYYAKQPQDSDYDMMAVFINKSLATPQNDEYVKILTNLQNAYFAPYDHLPIFLDGGCGVVRIFFNSQNMKFKKLRDPFSNYSDKTLYDGICNGSA